MTYMGDSPGDGYFDPRPVETWIVCGSRSYRSDIFDELDRLAEERGYPLTVRHGDCRGVDRQAHEWARQRCISVERCPADWITHGRAAGPIRNRQMLDAGADLVVAFPGGRGTADMVKQARARGVEVVMLGSEEDEA